MKVGVAAVAIAAAVLFVAGCGGGGKSSESEGKTACKGTAISGKSGLPGDFPAPGELTFTSTTTNGPTTIVEGYWESDLDEAYNELLDQVKTANYKVLFTENEHKDAEMSYSAPGATSGQIALRADCNEDGTTRVHITNRPS